MADLLAADCRRSRRRVDRDRRRGSSAAAGYGVETRRGCYHDGGRRQDRGTFAARFRRRSGWARPGAGRAARTRRGTGDRAPKRPQGCGRRPGGRDRRAERPRRRPGMPRRCCCGLRLRTRRRKMRGRRIRRKAAGMSRKSSPAECRRKPRRPFPAGSRRPPAGSVRPTGGRQTSEVVRRTTADGREELPPGPRQREAASMRSAAMRVRHPGPPHGSGCRSRCRREAASPGTAVRQDGRRIFP